MKLGSLPLEQAMSEYIERSKHPGMTAMVHDHIMGGQKGYNASDPLPRKGGNPPFGHHNTGLNYRDPSWAGDGPGWTEQFKK